MQKKLIVLFFFLAFVQFAEAQNIRRYTKFLNRQDYEKLESKLRKSLRKDSINPASHYFYSLLFLKNDFPRQQADSSYYHALKAQETFRQLPFKKQTKWAKSGLTADTLAYQKNLLDSLAFQQALSENSEAAYQRFLDIHPTASQADEARRLRNELAYAKAKNINTYQAFKAFAERYPQAIQVTEAKGLYNFLLFEEKTQDKDRRSFHRFIHEYPNNPYVNEAHHQLFEIITAPNTQEAYRDYLSTYPNSPYRQRAVNMLYHYYLEVYSSEEFIKQYPELVSDSLRLSARMADDLLIPVLTDSVYGFMNTSGRLIFAPTFRTISSDYKCEGVAEDFFVAGDQENPYIIAKNGSLIYSKPFDEVTDIGYGLLKIRKGNQYGVIHKAGYEILPVDYLAVSKVLDSFLLFKRGSKWGVSTFSGRIVFEPVYDSLYQEGRFLVLVKDDKLALTTKAQLMGAVDNSPVYLAFIYEDAEEFKEEYVVAYRNDQQTLLNLNLNPVIPLGEHRIGDWYGGWLLRSDHTIEVYDTQMKPLVEGKVSKAEHNANWLALKDRDKWLLINRNRPSELYHTNDSLRLLNDNYVILFKGDTTLALFDGGKSADISDHKMLRLLTAFDAETMQEESYLMVAARKEKKVYNPNGQVIVEGNYDEITPAGHHLLIVKKKNQAGLYSADGQRLLPARYDGIGKYRDGYVSVLEKGKFGLLDIRNNVLIKPQFSTHLEVYNNSYFIASQDRRQGLIDREGKAHTPFAFEQIMYWSDTVALVQEDGEWGLFNMKQNEYDYEAIDGMKVMKNDKEEVMIRVRREEKYGILSNTKGEIVPPAYDEVQNIGNVQVPVFLSELYIKDADFYVLIYYNASGKIIKKQAFDAYEYDMISCDE